MKNSKGFISNMVIIFMLLTLGVTSVVISIQQSTLYNETKQSVNSYEQKVNEMNSKQEDLMKEFDELYYNL